MFAGKTLSEVRRHGRYFLLLDHALVVTGFYTVFPLLSTHFVKDLSWSAAWVGFALGLRQVAQHGTGLLAGALADRYGGKLCICSGMLIRAASFAIFAYANSYTVLILACVLSGIGGALFEPPRSALAIKLSHRQERARFYSWSMAQESLLAGLGALLGVGLLAYDFYWVALCGCLCFSGVALLNWLFLPDYRISRRSSDWRLTMGRVLADRKFVLLVLSFTGYYLLYTQSMMLLPLHMQALTANTQTLAWMFCLHSSLALLMGIKLTHYLNRYFTSQQLILIGMSCLLFSMLGLALSRETAAAWFSLCLFYLGLVLVEPARESLLAQLSPAQARASYMGFARMGLALGGLLGYFGGGSLFALSQHTGANSTLFSILAAIACLTTFLLFHQFRSTHVLAQRASSI